MNDLKSNDKIATIPFGAILNVQISGAFYSRIQQLFYALLEEKIATDPTGFETNKILKELETREPIGKWEVTATLYLALLFAIEKAATEQKQLIQRDASEFFPKESSPKVSPEN